MKFYRDTIELEIDGTPTVSTTREGHVVEKYEIKGKNGFFVTLSGTHYCAHGETLEQAIADALWKDETKRPSREALKKQIQDDGEDRKISLNEFRVLTGACVQGCRLALKRASLDGSPMTAKEVYHYFPEWGRTLLKVLDWEEL